MLIVDDDPDFRILLRVQLEGVDELEVVGEAGDGQEAIDRALELEPDAIVMDILMPVLDGLQASERILETLPATHIVGYTAVAGEFVRRRTSEIGIGLVLKSGDPGPLFAALAAGR